MTIEENFADYHARIRAAGANAQVKDYFKAGYLFGAAAQIKSNEREAAHSEGWKLVPVEPTEKMLTAIVDPSGALKLPLDLLPYKPTGMDIAEGVYTAMLAAAPTPIENHWVNWDGGECPVPPEQQVELKLRGGGIGFGRADGFMWTHDEHDTNYGDIVTYRIAPA